MDRTIHAKELRASLPEIVGRIRPGERSTVLYRSRPAFRIVPIDDTEIDLGPVEDDPLYRAPALFHSEDGTLSRDHDAILYPKK